MRAVRKPRGSWPAIFVDCHDRGNNSQLAKTDSKKPFIPRLDLSKVHSMKDTNERESEYELDEEDEEEESLQSTQKQ